MTADSNVAQFIDWLARTCELHFDGYEPLRRWSVEQLEDFWAAVGISTTSEIAPAGPVPSSLEMNGARRFARARLNRAEQVPGRAPEDRPALRVVAEGREPVDWSTAQMRGQVGALAGSTPSEGCTAFTGALARARPWR
jgi:acetoacetyl-CoA synthetase